MDRRDLVRDAAVFICLHFLFKSVQWLFMHGSLISVPV